MQEDLATFDRVLTVLHNDDNRLIKSAQVSEYNSDIRPRTTVYNTESNFCNSLIPKLIKILKNCPQLKITKFSTKFS